MTRRNLLKGIVGALGAMIVTPVEHVLGEVSAFHRVHWLKGQGYLIWSFQGSGKSWPKIVYFCLSSMEEGWEPKRLDDIPVMKYAIDETGRMRRIN